MKGAKTGNMIVAKSENIEGARSENIKGSKSENVKDAEIRKYKKEPHLTDPGFEPFLPPL